MADKSSIEWTDATWNPVRGCSIVSKGCTNCYAMRQAHRQSGEGRAYEGLTVMSKGGPVWNGNVRLVPELLDQPLHWKRPRRIFVNSMSDLFHEGVPDSFIDMVFAVMANHGRHTYQVLTKRPARMLAYLKDLTPERVADLIRSGHGASEKWVTRDSDPAAWATEELVATWPLPNVWLGVSVEDQASADERIPLLLKTPAAVRWISAEPLLGPLTLTHLETTPGEELNALTSGIAWVVVGGESGPGARPMHPDWVRYLRSSCHAAGVPFFFKQWGSHLPGEIKRGELTLRWQDGRSEWYGDHQDIKYQQHWLANDERGLVIAWPTGKKAAGRKLDGRTHDEYPA